MDEPPVSTVSTEGHRRWSFTISDLLIASLFTAILFAMRKVQSDSATTVNTFHQALDIIRGFVHGFCLAAITRIIRTETSPGWASRLRHPGHWLLIQSALWMAVVFATFFPHLLFPEWKSYEAFQLARFAKAASGIAFLIACTVAAWRMQTRWRIFFMILATHALLEAATQVVNIRTPLPFDGLLWAESMTNLVAIVWLIYLLTIDHRQKIARDWMHWAGVGGWLALITSQFAIIRLTSWYYLWQWKTQ